MPWAQASATVYSRSPAPRIEAQASQRPALIPCARGGCDACRGQQQVRPLRFPADQAIRLSVATVVGTGSTRGLGRRALQRSLRKRGNPDVVFTTFLDDQDGA